MGLPLAFYEMLNSLYKILDSLMASHINASSVSTVAYLAQISILISAVGQGLSVGGGLKINEAYGAGDYTLVRRRVSSLFGISNTVTGIFANAQSGIQSGGAALISQNMGGKKAERVPDILKKIVLVNLMIGITGTILCYLGADAVSTIYASSSEGLDETFRQTIHGIFLYDSAGTIIS